MVNNSQIQIRDPFIVPVKEEGKYYMYGTTDKNCWSGKATGFDAYWGTDLQNWEGPFPVFRPEEDFWADQNFWAPEVYKYGDKYYMLASFNSDHEHRGTQILVSDNLKGPFVLHSDGPVTPRDWECLDGTLYVDSSGTPWMVFCHEWTQIHDGEICAMKLTKDLKAPIGESIVLFRASQAPWTGSFKWDEYKEGECYVTDGPFLYTTQNGELIMLWSSYNNGDYAIGVAKSVNGDITGPWIHIDEPLYKKDGGHGMVFKTFTGELMLTIHTPNDSPNERPIFIPLIERDGNLVVK